MGDYRNKSVAGRFDGVFRNIRRWKSMLQIMGDEILFIDRLLKSNAFEPNTPNLFERIVDYQKGLTRVIEEKRQLMARITGLEIGLGGKLEGLENSMDPDLPGNYEDLKAGFDNLEAEFQQLKSEIFNYAGAILQKSKSVE